MQLLLPFRQHFNDIKLQRFFTFVNRKNRSILNVWKALPEVVLSRSSPLLVYEGVPDGENINHHHAALITPPCLRASVRNRKERTIRVTKVESARVNLNIQRSNRNGETPSAGPFPYGIPGTALSEQLTQQRSIDRGYPFGDDSWFVKTAMSLARELTTRPRCRPKMYNNGS